MQSAGGPVIVVLERVLAYHLELLDGLRSALEPRGVPVLIHLSDYRESTVSDSLERVIRTLSPRGLIVTPMNDPRTDTALAGLLAGVDLPLVYLGKVAPFGVGSSVRGDNTVGMQLVARHLVRDCEAHRVLVVRGPRHQLDSQEREATLRRELMAYGLPVPDGLIVDGGFEREPSYRAVYEALRGEHGIDAIVALNDRAALGALDAVHTRGLRVPEDIVVTGFDDEELAAIRRPSLTTVNQNLREQGATAAALLLDLAEGQAPTSIRVPTMLTLRESTARGTSPSRALLPASVDPQQEINRLRSRVVALDTSLTISRSILTCESIQEVIDQITVVLPRLEARRAFLVLRPETEPATERGLVMLSYRAGSAEDVSDQQPFPLDQLLPPELAPELVSGQLTLQPLTMGGVDLGYLLIDLPPDAGRFAIETLRVDLLRILDAIRGTSELTEHAGRLEQLVARRTRQLQNEVAIRRRAEAELQRLNDELRLSLRVDGLTGIANRAAFDDSISTQWAAHTRSGQPLSLIMADVDHFKAYNDRYGHLPGDEALRVVADCLRRAIRRQGDLAARFGGEEFSVILPHTGIEGARVVAERIRTCLADEGIAHADAEGGTLTVSLGLATARPDRTGSPEDLISAADLALYDVKNAGRDGIGVADFPLPGA